MTLFKLHRKKNKPCHFSSTIYKVFKVLQSPSPWNPTTPRRPTLFSTTVRNVVHGVKLDYKGTAPFKCVEERQKQHKAAAAIGFLGLQTPLYKGYCSKPPRQV